MATNLTHHMKIHKLLITYMKTLVHTYVYQLYRFHVSLCTICDVWIWHILHKRDWQGIIIAFVLECIFQSVSKISCYSCLTNVFNFFRLTNNYIVQLFISKMHIEICNLTSNFEFFKRNQYRFTQLKFSIIYLISIWYFFISLISSQ